MKRAPLVHTQLLNRLASTSASESEPGSSAPAKAAPATLSWPEYLKIRRGRRIWELTATVPMTLGAFGGGLSYFGSIEPDPTALIMGLEPIWIYALATFSCAGAGYLVGPFIGSTLWRLTHRKKLSQIDSKEREFYQHIVRNRVDPSSQSATNPVPDYYGENVGSIKQYRQWLRDQSKYRRKAAWPEQ
ncbi:mitochondrial import protein Pam17 [Cantharellus anzutake]|uniref:mitochondrial import protein Pam17 n=1 Tax=Cantharellus anzutake TaxID=1750568 RepID=UPI0019041E4D|nr:mitochondrial import protein Pam17 [Cantharellus anzutake]KAF8322864.1 mitochondrial import protein Pam17 [Cantharellus anzutake]